MDPLSKLIDEALGKSKQPYHQVLPTDHEDNDSDTGLFSVVAIFTYSNETTTRVSFPRKPIGLTKRINGQFERPVSVKFKLMDADFRPKQRKNLEHWKNLCRTAIKSMKETE